MNHIMKFILEKHRKYNLKGELCEPEKNTIVNTYKIHSFPASFISNNNEYIIYNGTDIHQIETCIKELIR